MQSPPELGYKYVNFFQPGSKMNPFVILLNLCMCVYVWGNLNFK